MEWIKDIVRQFYPLMIAVSCVLFVVWIFFASGLEDDNGVFERSGSLFCDVLDTGELRNEGTGFVKNNVSGYVPVVKYTGGVRACGEILLFKDLFQIRKEDGSWEHGGLEDDFTIFLMDIRNQYGKSVMVNMTEEEIAGIENIPSAFVYEKDLDLLCCFLNGIYTVSIKIYAANGGMAIYEFSLPVESG